MVKAELNRFLKDIKLLIFDIDGVLVDVRESYRKAIRLTAEHFSQTEIHPDEIQKLKNESGFNNDWDLTEELLRRKGFHPKRETLIETFQALYWGEDGDGYIASEPWLMDNMLLKGLSENYQMAVFTGRPRLEAEFVLSKNNVIHYFNPIIAMEDVTKGKPDPEGIFTILNRLSMDPKMACYFGDTYDDVRAAKNAGILPIAVLPPGAKEDSIGSFLSEGAITVFRSINELISIYR